MPINIDGATNIAAEVAGNFIEVSAIDRNTYNQAVIPAGHTSGDHLQIEIHNDNGLVRKNIVTRDGSAITNYYYGARNEKVKEIAKGADSIDVIQSKDGTIDYSINFQEGKKLNSAIPAKIIKGDSPEEDWSSLSIEKNTNGDLSVITRSEFEHNSPGKSITPLTDGHKAAMAQAGINLDKLVTINPAEIFEQQAQTIVEVGKDSESPKIQKIVEALSGGSPSQQAGTPVDKTLDRTTSITKG